MLRARERLDGHAVASRLLADRPWAHETRRIGALGWDFTVRTDVPGLGDHLDSIFAAMAIEGDASHHYSLIRSDRRTWLRHRLYRDSRRILDTPDPTRALAYLLWDINQQVFRSSPDKLLVHAAALEHRGRAALLSAPSEAGKSTLAAGLVERGLGYLSDEAAAIDVETLLVHAYPKALSLRPGSQAVLPHLEPPVTAAVEPFVMGAWQVPPDAIRPDATMREPIAAAWIIVPAYRTGAPTSLEQLSRGEALALLMEQGLNLHHHGRHGFERLAVVVQHCRCARLVFGDLASGCDAVRSMLDDADD